MFSTISKPRPANVMKMRVALQTFAIVLALLIGHAVAAQIEKRAAGDHMSFGTALDACIRSACADALPGSQPTTDHVR